MIPYFRFTVIPVGPVDLQVWGLMVALGILAAVAVAAREAKRAGLDPDVMRDLAVWLVVPALIGGRLLHVAAYEPAAYLADPWAVLRVWEGGLSSFGGFIGAAAGGFIFFRRRPHAAAALHGYLEAGAFAFPLGYGIGRIGCFLIHDHPGTLSHSLLAVRYPDGPRIDHGLMLSLMGFAMFGLFLMLKRGRPVGTATFRFFPLVLVLYGAVRFPLDFFRAYDLPFSDARYAGLTPAQYGSLLLVAAGLVMGYHVLRTRRRARTVALPK